MTNAGRVLLALTALLAWPGFGPGSVLRAQEVSPAERRREIDDQIARLGRELQGLSSSERGLLGEIDRLSALEKLRELETRRCAEESRAVQQDLQATQLRLASLQEGESALRTRLADRLRRLYMAGPAGPARRLFSPPVAGQAGPGDAPPGAASPPDTAESTGRTADSLVRSADPAAALRYATAVTASDAALVENARAVRRAVETAGRDMAQRREQLETAGREASRAALDLAAARHEREQALARLRTDRTSREGALAELRRAAAALEGMARDLSRGASHGSGQRGGGMDFARFRGLLPWPAGGRVRSGFGRIVDPRFQTSVPHDGLDIEAEPGSDIRSVFEGKVVFAGWLSGYGLTLMIDHGGGWMSVSAHASVLMVEKGEAVPAGRVVGKVGDTGSLSGPSLYFEIRKDGHPVDPGVWLKHK